MTYEAFLSPGKIGNLELKNRSIFPPMGTGFADEQGMVTDRLINYHVRRVQGGCAMNIVEIASVHITSYGPPTPGIFDDKFLPGLTRLASAIKDAGGIPCIQLWHGGRQTSGKPYGGPPWAPSATTCPMIQEEAHAMTKEEIKEVVQSYGDAALRAKKAGFQAVELHGAHGYLIDEFLNPYTNLRTDEYGGSMENRTRFAREIMADVRKKVGEDFPVLMRMSLSENVEGGITVEDGLQAAKIYEETGVDALDISQGCYGAIPFTVPPYYLPVGVNVENAAAVKKQANIPVIVAGRIYTPELADEIISSGKADFISLGRVQLADPDFVMKTAEDNVDEIVHCIACDQGCVTRMFAGFGASCTFNPSAGYEAEVIITPAEAKKKILVIGGGPGGLEAARIAAERGHSVTLLEKAGELGGQFITAGYAPGKKQFAEAAIHMGYRAAKAGVDIRLYTKATPERIKKIAPDEIIIATGSEPLIPNIPGIYGKNVFEARSVIGANQYIEGQNIIVVGGGLVGLEAMEILTYQGKKVSIVEMDEAVGKDMEMYIIPHFTAFMAEHAIPVHTNAKCVAIKENSITIETDGKTSELPCDAVIIATGAKSNRQVEEMVKQTDIPYQVIGDAEKPAKVIDAIWRGNEIARVI